MRSHYIIDSAATLLGVALLVVTAVHITGKAAASIADELSFGAALLFLGSCAASHRAIASRTTHMNVLPTGFSRLALSCCCAVS